MTADAKVGLLLGLFFIVIIAFLVNGLPNFMRAEHPLPPDAAILTPKGPDLVLDEREVFIPRLDPGNNIPAPTTPESSKPLVLDTTDPADRVRMPDLSQPRQTQDSGQPLVVDTTDLIKTDGQTTSTPPATATRTHTVAKGENLAVIAKKYYKEEGNRLAIIKKLYEANKDVLKSPDTVRLGDTLTIPLLDELQNEKKTVVTAPSPSKNFLKAIPDIFEKVTNKKAASVTEYVVQEGDNLWSIAEEQLDDGKRFTEIKRLNKIKDEDKLVIGDRIKIPAHPAQ